MSGVRSQPLSKSSRIIFQSQTQHVDAHAHTTQPTLIGLGSVVPPVVQCNADLEDSIARLWNLDRQTTARWRRINRGCGVRRRHGVQPVEKIIHLSTAERMGLYEQHAPPLAALAAQRALNDAHVSMQSITDLIIVTCTGFSAPGVDVAMVKQLGLPADVRRTTVGFMGCFGAITGLRHAVGVCAADPNAVALVVCVELCSLHLRASADADNLVASALFSDGVAAAVVAGHERRADVQGHNTRADDRRVTPALCDAALTMGHSRLLAGSEHAMSWRMTDTGFTMTLARDVPEALQNEIRSFLGSTGGANDALLAHPGGPAILDAIETGLDRANDPGINISRAILREFGNMSSATVLFVLQRAMKYGMTPPITLLAFGPGLTIESLRLLPGPSR